MTGSMENGTNQHNGGIPLLPQAMTDVRAPLDSIRFDKVMVLIAQVTDLEFAHRKAMTDLERELRQLNHAELPLVVINLVRSVNPIVPPHPQLAKTVPVAVTKKERIKSGRVQQHKNKGGALKASILGLMSDKKERKSSIIVHKLGAKNPTSVYTVLTKLAEEGHLIRTRFAHYRLKLRRA